MENLAGLIFLGVTAIILFIGYTKTKSTAFFTLAVINWLLFIARYIINFVVVI